MSLPCQITLTLTVQFACDSQNRSSYRFQATRIQAHSSVLKLAESFKLGVEDVPSHSTRESQEVMLSELQVVTACKFVGTSGIDELPLLQTLLQSDVRVTRLCLYKLRVARKLEAALRCRRSTRPASVDDCTASSSTVGAHIHSHPSGKPLSVSSRLKNVGVLPAKPSAEFSD
ncbi:hypothetical protein MRX96_029488 [Rhipicephalus microplus]